MIKPEQIPHEVCRAADDAWHSGLPEADWQVAIAAAINAWPGAFPWTFNGPPSGASCILPLPQEKNHD